MHACDRIVLGEFETFLTQPQCGKKTKLKEKKVNKRSLLYLTRGALIAALYVALTYLSALFGLSSGVIQFRISEALCILPIFMPEAIPGLAIGCMIANLATGAVFWDILFGTLATLIGALGAYLLRKLPEKLIFIATLPTVVSNTLIIPAVLIYAYGAPDAYPYLMLTVAIGEIVCALLGGDLLYHTLKKTRFHLFINNTK